MKHIEQKLVNWGEWMRRREDNGLGFGNSPMARLMGASARVEAGSSVQVDEIEASKTDSAVQSLPRNLRQYADLWFVQQLPVREVAQQVRHLMEEKIAALDSELTSDYTAATSAASGKS